MIRADFLAALGATGATQIADLAPYTPTSRIALVCPQSGPDANAGKQLVQGAQAAVDEIIRSRLLTERAFLLTAYDDHNDAADAIVQGGFAAGGQDVIAVVGHLSAAATLAALDLYANNNVALVVPTVTDDRVTAKGYRNVFRLPAKDSDEGSLIAAFAIATGAKSPHVVTQDGDYGPEVATGFTRRAASLHVEAGLMQFSLDKPDVPAVVTAVLAKNPDLVALAGNVGDMGPLLPALRVAGYSGRIIASQGFFDGETLKRYAKEAEGILVSSDVPYYPLAPVAQRDVQLYEARYGRLSPIAAFGYAAVQLVRTALRRTGAADRLGLIRALTSGGGVYDTITGSYTFAASGDPVDPNCYFYRVKDGKFAYERQAHASGFMLK